MIYLLQHISWLPIQTWIVNKAYNWHGLDSTVVHDFNGHEVNGIHGLYGKKGYDEALYSVNKRHDITGIHDIDGNFP